MKLYLHSEHFTITEALKQHIEKQARLLIKHIPKQSNIYVTLSKASKNYFMACYHVKVGKLHFRAKDISNDLYHAIVQARRSIQLNMTKFQHKRISQKRRATAIY